MIRLLVGIAAAAAGYQAAALIAAVRHLRQREPQGRRMPPVSVLKPVHGLDPNCYEALRSHAVLDYPEFEILFGVRGLSDASVPVIRRVMEEHPHVLMRLVPCATEAPNGKVGLLADLAAQARHPVLVVNDADIAVEPDYLRRVTAPLEDPGVGMVTCLYRAEAEGCPGWFEAVGIATDFAPSVLVARLVGVSEFALGSTMAFRATDLARIGGFAAIADFIADDYQLSRRIRDLGLKVVLSSGVVRTFLGDRTWGEAWRRQVRWARTIRVSRPGGYLGMPVTMATLWVLLLAAAGRPLAAGVLFGLRLAAGLFTARFVLREQRLLLTLLLMPLRDFWGAAVWAAGLFGRTVVWRGKGLRLTGQGRIVAGPASRGEAP